MAKRKFSWSNLPAELLDALCEALGLESTGADALGTAFGTRPTESFVRAAWPTLRDRWLVDDAMARRSVVEALRARRLGDPTMDTDSPAGQLAYLRSCRNGASLRDVVLDAFVASGEHAPVAPSLPSAAEVGDEVLRLMRRVTENAELEPDEDGDIALRFGSSAVFVRVFGEPPVIRVYAPTLTQVPHDPGLADAVNDLNRASVFTKWVLMDDMVVAVMDLFGTPFSEDAVLQACEVVGNSADEVDEGLQTRFGGKTFFGEYAPPKLPGHLAGYL